MGNVQKSPLGTRSAGARRGGRLGAVSGVVLGGAAVAGTVLAGAVLAGTVLAGVVTALMARAIVTPPRPRGDDTRILHTRPGTVTLQATPDSVLPGEYSFFFGHGAGHARLGAVLQHGAGLVTRQVIDVDGADLALSRTGRFSGWVYRTPHDVGGVSAEVQVPTPAGDAPAWLFPAAAGPDAAGAEPTDVPVLPAAVRWVIQVHGRGASREEALRAVPVFRDSGYTSLIISYRNDGDAPPTYDGRYGLGDTEWLDVEAAIDFAVQNGAETIVLMGWSMGGAIALQAVTRTRFAGCISGVVLESPVIDWADVLAHQGALNRLPVGVSRGAMAVMGWRFGGLLTGQSTPINFRRLDFVTRAAELSVPILLLHSDDDGFVPSTGSRALAALRPDIVTFVPFEAARHTKLWNYDRELWTGSISRWLSSLPGPRHPGH